MNLTLTVCAFTHLSEAERILIPELYVDKDDLYDPYIITFSPFGKKISELFPVTFSNCNITKTELVKDISGTPLDEESGLGITNYDSINDILVIDKSLRGGKYDFFIQITTVLGEVAHWPVTVFVFRAHFEPRYILRQFVYNDGEIDDEVALEDVLS